MIERHTRGLGHHWFVEELRKVAAPSILELGSRRIEGQAGTLRKDWVPHAGEYLGTDFQAGEDVDIVADLHSLSATVGVERFDGIISCSTLEHVQFPWLAAVEICRALKPAGLLFVQTHHTYPLHGFPDDYWRFTEDGLATLFSPQIGFEIISTTSDIPCAIVSEREPHLAQAPSYLNVLLIARKLTTPAADYQWRVL